MQDPPCSRCIYAYQMCQSPLRKTRKARYTALSRLHTSFSSTISHLLHRAGMLSRTSTLPIVSSACYPGTLLRASHCVLHHLERQVPIRLGTAKRLCPATHWQPTTASSLSSASNIGPPANHRRQRAQAFMTTLYGSSSFLRIHLHRLH